jgi:hypothetical protein
LGAALCGAIAVPAALEWHRSFGFGALVPVLVAAVVPVLLALGAAVGRDRPRPLPVVGSVSVLGLLGLLVAVSGPSPLDVVDGLVNGWSRLLTTAVPAPADGDLLALPVALTWPAALIGVELVLRIRRPALGLLAPLGAYLVALVFNGGLDGARLGWVATVVALALGAVLVLRPVPGTGLTATAGPARSTTTGTRLAGVAVVGVSVLGAVLIGPRLPLADARDPYDPRAGQQPPTDDLTAIDPLSLLAGWAATAENDEGTAVAEPLFTVRAPAPHRWRLAVLDRYDPVTGWSSSTRLIPSGETLPPAPPTVRSTSPLDQAVTIVALDGPWLPAADRPTRVQGTDVLVDPDTGVIARVGGTERGLRYEVRSEVTAAQTPDCTLSVAGALTDADLADPVPSELVALAQRLTQGATSPCERLRRLQAHLTSAEFQFAPEAPTGTNLRRILELLELAETRPEATTRRGTSEQYATALALMARSLGLPARVVVGFNAGDEVGGIRQVRPEHGFAWVEVRFEDLGWIFVDPTPASGERPPAPELEETEVDAEEAGASPDGTAREAPVEREVDDGATAARPGWAQASLAVGVMVAALALAMGLLAVTVAAVRRRRRRRRARAPDPARRVVGAWRQCLDELRAAGVSPAPSDTATDCVARTHEVLGPAGSEPMKPVATMVNGVLFAEWSPEAHHADSAWEHTNQVARAVAADRSHLDRVRHALDVRVLVGR